MFRETPMLGVSVMMLHHLIVTFKDTVSVCEPISLTLLAAKLASLRYLFDVCLVRCWCARQSAMRLRWALGFGLDAPTGTPNSSRSCRAWFYV
jgi:hypothetical protein